MIIFLSIADSGAPEQKRIEVDESLFPRIAEGDKEAFICLYEQSRNAVFSYALSLLRNYDDAEDAAPQVEQLSPIDELLKRSKDDDWQLKGLARAIVRAKGEVMYSDKQAFDKAVNSEKARLKKRFASNELDWRLLKKVDVRILAMLTECSVKQPKPRPDGSVGQKWAILSLDDGNAQADAFAYAKTWEKCSSLADRKDQLVVVCGEVAHRTNYEKEDVHKEHPTPGDISFSVKEAYPAEEAMPLISKSLHVRIDSSDPAAEARTKGVVDVVMRHPGALPMQADVAFGGGRIAEVEFGQAHRVAVTVGFLSELAKAVPLGDVSSSPDDRIYFEP